MTIKIVTDSSCDLPIALIKTHHITVIPLFINVGEREYQDGIDISRQEFYERLPQFRPSPTTAAPGPDIIRYIYERLAAEGATEILSIHISIKLSGILNIARQAAGETSVVPVTVFDSHQLSLGTGFEVLAAAKAAEQGRSMQEIIELLNEQISRTHVFAALDTLEFLRRSGRMNAAISRLGELLQIKPLLRMFDGNPTAERVRTRKKALKRLIELLKEAAPFEQVAILHSHAADRASALLDEVKPLLPDGNILFEEITPVLGAHLGPGVIGFACISQQSERSSTHDFS
jgi:DegV family protein with EDD domain